MSQQSESYLVSDDDASSNVYLEKLKEHQRLADKLKQQYEEQKRLIEECQRNLAIANKSSRHDSSECSVVDSDAEPTGHVSSIEGSESAAVPVPQTASQVVDVFVANVSKNNCNRQVKSSDSELCTLGSFKASRRSDVNTTNPSSSIHPVGDSAKVHIEARGQVSEDVNEASLSQTSEAIEVSSIQSGNGIRKKFIGSFSQARTRVPIAVSSPNVSDALLRTSLNSEENNRCHVNTDAIEREQNDDSSGSISSKSPTAQSSHSKHLICYRPLYSLDRSNSETFSDVTLPDCGEDEPDEAEQIQPHQQQTNTNLSDKDSLVSSGSDLADTTKLSNPVTGTIALYRDVVASIIQSEETNLECLSSIIQFIKPIETSMLTTQPLTKPDDFAAIFFKCPEMYELHRKFLHGLKESTENWDGTTSIGENFLHLANNMDVYDLYLSNHQYAIETVRRCAANDARFRDIASVDHKVCSGTGNLENLLQRSISGILQRAPMFNDLLQHIPADHPDHELVKSAISITKSQPFFTKKYLCAGSSVKSRKRSDRERKSSRRRLKQNAFVAQLVDNTRKLRRLYLLSDAVVCVKQKFSGRSTVIDSLEMKWWIPLKDVQVSCLAGNNSGQMSEVADLRFQMSNLRAIIDQSAHDHNHVQKTTRSNISQNQLRNKFHELQKLLALKHPDLAVSFANRSSKQDYIILFSSPLEQQQLVHDIERLQRNTLPAELAVSVTSQELISWFTDTRQQLVTCNTVNPLHATQPWIGDNSESLSDGQLHLLLHEVAGLQTKQDVYMCVEVDCYGHFARRVRTPNVSAENASWQTPIVLELEGSSMLRLLCYRQGDDNSDLFENMLFRHDVRLISAWLPATIQEMTVQLPSGVSLRVSVRFVPRKLTVASPPVGKPKKVFGVTLELVCQRENRSVPFVITSCVREVEERGLVEVGIYRLSGSALHIKQLMYKFDSDVNQAQKMIKEADIHVVACLLKDFLRQLPESLFTECLNRQFISIFQSCSDTEECNNKISELFSQLPQLNQTVIFYIIEHLVKVSMHANENKMTLENLSTVFGPTLLNSASRDMATEGGVGGGDAKKLDAIALSCFNNFSAETGVLYILLKYHANEKNIEMTSSPAATPG